MPEIARRPPALDFAALPRERLEAMHDAAETVLRCEAALRASNMSVLSETLRDQGDFVVWERYPRGDVFDARSGAQYFYHAHTPDEMGEAENGHFHLFLRPWGAGGEGPEPLRLPGARIPEDPQARFLHLAALGVDGAGRPLRWFTTNRWVTDETFVRAGDAMSLLDRFEIGLAYPNWAVSEWLGAMVRLYAPQIEALLRLRDEAVEDWTARHPDAETLEDRRLQNVSEIDINLPAHIAAIEAALGL